MAWPGYRRPPTLVEQGQLPRRRNRVGILEQKVKES